MKPAILFDLGNTLAAYYRKEESPVFLERCITEVWRELRQRELVTLDCGSAVRLAAARNRQPGDFRFLPLEERLASVFQLPETAASELLPALCERFLAPIFGVGRLYEETLPVLEDLKAQGYRTAIVSNSPWGSPPGPWRREVQRLGIAPLVDRVVMCGDVGWRKPARQIFEHTAAGLGVSCADCLFVGDDLEWDIAGSAAAGMRPILVDREGRYPAHQGTRITSLRDLAQCLDLIADAQGPAFQNSISG